MSKSVKCLVWDLDDTLWEGVLLEGGGQRPRPGAQAVIQELDRRGILQSVASRNTHEHAMRRLAELGLAEFFLYPQIHFGPKSASVQAIAAKLNIGLDTLAFIDDQPFERAEVGGALPQVLCLDAAELSGLPDLSAFIPRFVTDDSAKRRHMYQTDMLRTRAEEDFSGPAEAFLQSLDMRLSIDPVTAKDLQRAVDLTERTHQLNATGLTFSHDELEALIASPRHLLLMNSLTDTFGDYGKIGLSLLEKGDDIWTLRLMLMSCRVMSRGVGSCMLNFMIRHALASGRTLHADFMETDRNRIMYVTYRFAGFEELRREGARVLLHRPGMDIPAFPPHLRMEVTAPDLAY